MEFLYPRCVDTFIRFALLLWLYSVRHGIVNFVVRFTLISGHFHERNLSELRPWIRNCIIFCSTGLISYPCLECKSGYLSLLAKTMIAVIYDIHTIPNDQAQHYCNQSLTSGETNTTCLLLWIIFLRWQWSSSCMRRVPCGFSGGQKDTSIRWDWRICISLILCSGYVQRQMRICNWNNTCIRKDV